VYAAGLLEDVEVEERVGVDDAGTAGLPSTALDEERSLLARSLAASDEVRSFFWFCLFIRHAKTLAARARVNPCRGESGRDRIRNPRPKKTFDSRFEFDFFSFFFSLFFLSLLSSLFLAPPRPPSSPS